MRNLNLRSLVLALSLRLALALVAAEPTGHKPATVPGRYDGLISRVTAQLLEKFHYLQQPLNDEMAGQFLDRYLNSLEFGQHLFFLESDRKEFGVYRTTLDDLTGRYGDVSPAHIIFARFLERLKQNYDYVNQLLDTDKFDFNSDDRFEINRRKSAPPKDLADAQRIWRDRLRSEYLEQKLRGVKPEEIAKTLKKRYTRIWNAYSKYDSDDILQVYLTALTRSYDPHSDYMGKAESENFSISMKLSLFGIGAQLTSEDGYCTIVHLMPGPAMLSKKLKPKDRIVAVAQGNGEPVDVVDEKLSKVVELIRGPKGTEVRLTVIPADAPDPSVRNVVSLIRDEIKLADQEAKASVIDLPNGPGKTVRLGVIDLPSFYADFGSDEQKAKSERKSTTADVSRLITKLKQENIGGLILDLRRNGGGSLEEAVNLTGLFIKKGPVVEVKDSLGRVIKDEDKDPSILYDGPLIVLTSRFSASASEILAGALKDYHRALIVGDSSTHGKGTVQTLLELAPYLKSSNPEASFNPGAIKVTIRKFYLPSGDSTQLKGVTPHIVLPSINNHREVGESTLENPLPWDTIPSAKFDKLNRVQPYLDELKRLSEARVNNSPDFAYIRREAARYDKMMADRTVSLNEEQRRKEKKEADERVAAHKKELLARKASENKIYKLTLKDAALPGLPAAGGSTNLAQVAQAAKAAAPAKAAAADPDDDATEEGNPAEVDAALEEAMHILVDYISLQGKGAPIAASN